MNYLILTPLLLCLPTLAQVSGPHAGATGRSAETCPLFVEGAPGRYDLLWVGAAGRVVATPFADLELIDAELPGFAAKDILRPNLPRPFGGRAGLPEGIELPGGAHLFLVRSAGATSLLLVPPTSAPRRVFSLPDPVQGSALLPQVHVSTDARFALLASPPQAGGDVYRVDLLSGTAECVTLATAALDVEGDSLRVSASCAWFVAGGDLWRARRGESASPVSVAALPEEEVLSDPVLSAQGDHLAFLLEGEDDQRRLALAGTSGAASLLTATPREILEPDADDSLGPFLSIAQDGSRVAWIEQQATHELFVADAPQQTALHITVDPEFPTYLDNVGVLGFANPGRLCFFAGDLQLSTVDEDDVLGASEMYSAFFDGSGNATYFNVTRTNGQALPPFTELASLNVTEALVDPSGLRFILVGEDELENQTLSCFPIAIGPPDDTDRVQLLLDGLDEDPELFLAGDGVLVLAAIEEEDDFSPGGGSDLYLLELLGAGVTAQPLASYGAGSLIDRFTHAGHHAAWVEATPFGERVHRADLSNGAVELLLDEPGGVVSPVGLLPGGRALLGRGANAGALQFLHLGRAGAATPLPLAPSSGFPIPR